MNYAIGDFVFNDWQITREIGEGATGKVFEIEKNDSVITAKSALKVIRIPRSVSDVKTVIFQKTIPVFVQKKRYCLFFVAKILDNIIKLVYYLTMTVIHEKKEAYMEYNSSLPIYLQAADSIKRDIVTGKLSPGAKLPSVRDLAVEYTINPNTVSRVYKELEMEGICFTRRGMGTFVTEDARRVQMLKEEMAGTLIREFLEGMEQLGFSRAEAIGLLEEEQSKE